MTPGLPTRIIAACLGLFLWAFPGMAKEQGTQMPSPWGDEISAELRTAIETVFVDSLPSSSWGPKEERALGQIVASGDPRVAWIIADMMRFTWRPAFEAALAEAGATLVGFDYTGYRRW